MSQDHSRSRFRYVGQGPGYGHVHFITSFEEKIVTTWSIPQGKDDPINPKFGGYSWLGPVSDFNTQFQKIA